MREATKALSPLYIPSLDGLRACSILIVFLNHVGYRRFCPGAFGVTIFFFLSGYLITTLLRCELEQTGRISLRNFYARRTLRIFPPLYLILGLAVLLALMDILPGGVHWRAIGAQALYLTNYYEIQRGTGDLIDGTGVLWSLAVEEHFYLLFPLLYMGVARCLPDRKKQASVFIGICGLVLAWRLALVYGFGVVPASSSALAESVSFPRLSYATDTRMDSILFGCILGIVGNPALDEVYFSKKVWIGIGVPLGIALYLATTFYRDVRFRETYRYTLQGLALYPVFVAAIRYPDWFAFKVLNLKPVKWIGVLSYSLYLCHHIVVEAVFERLPSLHHYAQVGLAAVLSLTIAEAIHLFVETPLARIRKRMGAVGVKAQADPRGSRESRSPSVSHPGREPG